MCLVVIAAGEYAGRQRLVICANRDEYHVRPAEPLHWWPDHPAVAGGRDSTAGGTWLAVARTGRFALVLNARETAPTPPAAPSRGTLVTRFLTEAGYDAAAIASSARQYAGFHWLGGDDGAIDYVTPTRGRPQRLTDAVIACGNWGLERIGPRAEQAHYRIGERLAKPDPTSDLFAILGDDTPLSEAAPGRDNGDTRPVFIRGPEFGTRCSSVVLIEEHRIAFHERRFDAAGREAGERTLAWPRRSAP